MLFLAFPGAYATAFSGFYLALMVVPWLIILRGVAIEFRSRRIIPAGDLFSGLVSRPRTLAPRERGRTVAFTWR